MIRRARVSDIPAIHRLVNEFAREELMLPLSIGEITERIRDFLVADGEGEDLAGCVAIHVTWERLVELRSLAVSRSAQGSGLGRRLVEAGLEEARALGAEEMFTLTYIPDFFLRFGFRVVDRSTLPHKVWQDCTKCTKFPDCGETALVLPLDEA
jgi:amino-acid N-acetyltransferase